jgi:hypothetical protein
MKSMFDLQTMTRLVDMQNRSYELLKWLVWAASRGIVSLESARAFASLPKAAESWLSQHLANVPEHARPNRSDIAPFCEFFSTYLSNTFELESHSGNAIPGGRYLADAPKLKIRKLTSADKRRADRMRVAGLANLAAEMRTTIDEPRIESLCDDPKYEAMTSLYAYGRDLQIREKGIASGPGVLGLWRGFARDSTGSPLPQFRLTAEMIVEAERTLAKALQVLSETNA